MPNERIYVVGDNPTTEPIVRTLLANDIYVTLLCSPSTTTSAHQNHPRLTRLQGDRTLLEETLEGHNRLVLPNTMSWAYWCAYSAGVQQILDLSQARSSMIVALRPNRIDALPHKEYKHDLASLAVQILLGPVQDAIYHIQPAELPDKKKNEKCKPSKEKCAHNRLVLSFFMLLDSIN
ncbi:hypothetical protein BCR43DRAFT_511180 [Syncephalastrum racemosum]|uniref:NAD(P)-binding domain-containing protein n=1 Tax=Syncephalastrum racemosum TaxID=13706 RepID=A0A1X2HLJ1_SYNRA|nr:hypothetical protein BCR43DRAFT_511180 [Syncephalastrum racemosum]